MPHDQIHVVVRSTPEAALVEAYAETGRCLFSHEIGKPLTPHSHVVVELQSPASSRDHSWRLNAYHRSETA